MDCSLRQARDHGTAFTRPADSLECTRRCGVRLFASEQNRRWRPWERRCGAAAGAGDVAQGM